MDKWKQKKKKPETGTQIRQQAWKLPYAVGVVLKRKKKKKKKKKKKGTEPRAQEKTHTPMVNRQLAYDTKGKNIQWRKESL